MTEDQKPKEDQKSEETEVKPEDIKIIYSSGGEPFVSESGAKKAMKMKGLDPDLWEPAPITGKPTNEDPMGTRIEGYVLRKVQPKEKHVKSDFYRVRFTEKSNPADPDDVMLAVNGENLICQRGVEVIIPARFKECADHGTFPVFKQLPNKPRKIVAKIQYFPYQYMGPATEADFVRMKKEGTKKTKEHVKQFGFHYDPDRAED